MHKLDVSSYMPNPVWLNEEGLQTLQRGYLLPGESPRDMYLRVAFTAAKYLKRPELQQDFFDILYKGYLGLATPVASNFGTTRGLPISCYSVSVSDSISSIYSHLKEVAMLSKHGGGVGVYYGNIRPTGAPISVGGVATGIVPVAQQYDKCARYVSQGCYSADTEILTNKGWILFSELDINTDVLVAQVREDKTIEYVKATDYIAYEIKEPLYNFVAKDKSIDLLVTSNHNMVIEKRRRVSNKRNKEGKFLNNKREYTNALELVEASNLKCHRDNFFVRSKGIEGNSITSLEQLCIAYQADGSTNPVGNSKSQYIFHLTKKRKITRLKSILNSLMYSYKEYQKENSVEIIVDFPFTPSKKLKDVFDLTNMSYTLAIDILNEVAEWDGQKPTETSIQYSCVDKSNVDFIEAVAMFASCITNSYILQREGKQDLYNIYITLNKTHQGLERVNVEKVNYEGYVYCVTVPSNKIIVRRKGRTYVCGNSIRRGAFAHYINADHPDAYELLLAKDHLEGDPRDMVDGNVALVVTDAFMYRVMANDPRAVKVFSKALEMNLKVGSPYFIFIDNVNRLNPDAYKNHGLMVETSNLCSEIMLFTDENHSFVCCLSSLNLFKWDEWKDWRGMNTGMSVPELSIYLLDAVLEEFIKRAKPLTGMGRAVRSAEKGRALGLGVMGLHHLYQLHGLPFKSQKARDLNIEIFKTIKEQSVKASENMAVEYGQPLWCEGTNVRHTHLLAVAPTRTNSVISGAFSPGIEPIDNNSYTAKQAKGSFVRKNPLLVKLLEERGCNTPEIWDSILDKNGSSMHLECLTLDEKLTFLTGREIPPEELIKQAADRTSYICQGQSLNRFVHPSIPVKKFAELVFKAWKSGCKSTYYTKSSSEKVIAKVRYEAHIITKEGCPYCEMAKELMNNEGISYTEYDRSEATEFKIETVPQIWYQSHYIGGYDDLVQYLNVKERPIKLVDGNSSRPQIVLSEPEDCLSCQG